MSDILISEIFGPTIQGEGALAGRLTVFVRTGGCDFRCNWCDTLYAVLPEFKSDWTKMSALQIIEKVEEHSGGKPILVTVSGGNPALAPLGELLEMGHARGHTFALETQGTKAPGWLSELDHLTISPKPPSSGMTPDWDKLRECVRVGQGGKTGVSLKVVVFDDEERAARFDERAEGRKKFVDVVEVEAGRRLVEDVERACPCAFREVRGELDTLRRAARKRRRGLTEA